MIYRLMPTSDSVTAAVQELAEAPLQRQRVRRTLFKIVLVIALVHVCIFAIVYLPYALRGYSDFAILYTAGTIVNEGNAERLYDNSLQWETQQRFCDVPIRQGPLLFNHAPYEALIAAPFARISYPHAFLAWTLFNAAVLIGIGYILRNFVQQVVSRWWVLPLLALSYFPVFMSFVQGQDSLLILLCFAAALVALKSGRPFSAGAVVALASVKPQLVLPFIVVFALRRQWRVVAGFACAACILVALSVAIVGLPAALGYIEFLVRFNAMPADVSAAPAFNMPNLRGVVYTLFGSTGHWSRTAVLGLASAFVLWVASRGRSVGTDLAFSLAIVASLLASYHLYAHDVALGMLAVLAAWTGTQRKVTQLTVAATNAPWVLSPLVFFLWFHNLACLMALPLLAFLLVLWNEARQSCETRLSDLRART